MGQVLGGDEADLAKWFAHPLVRMHASQELKRIALYSQQLEELETTILALAKQEQSYELLQKPNYDYASGSAAQVTIHGGL